MSGLEGIGDMGDGLQGLAAAAQLWAMVSARRTDQAAQFLEMLDELLDRPDAAQAIADDPVTAEVFALLLPRAAETATDEHRRLLARVVARAASGPVDDAEVDPRPQFARAAAALDPPHMLALQELERPRRLGGLLNPGVEARGMVTGEALIEALPQLGALAYPIMHGLEAAGLATTVGTYDGTPAWMTTDFGRDFLDWIGE